MEKATRFLLLSLWFTGAFLFTASSLDAQTCNPPTGISVLSVTSNTATIGFTPAPGASYTYIHYRESGATYWYTYSANSSLSSQTISGLSDSTTYEIELRSYCGSSAYSSWTSIISFTTLAGNPNICPAPAGITVTAITNNSATLNWTASSGAYYYYIYYKKSTDATWMSTSSNTNSKSIFYLTDTTQYDYKIRSYCSGIGYGMFSSIGTFTTTNVANPCTPPTNISSGNITANSVEITWTAVPGVMYYYLQYREAGAISWTSSSSSTTSRTLGALVDSTTYEFQLRSYCGSGGYGIWSPTYTFTTLSAGNACPAPTGFVVSAVTNNSATISWNATPGTSYYYIYYKKSSDPNWSYSSTNTNSKTLFYLQDSTQYDYKIRSYCSGFGYGSFSAINTFTTTNTASPCTPPANITVGNITSNSAEITWTTVPGVMYYYIQFREVGTSNWLTYSSSTNSRTLTALIDSTTYEFQMRSYCGSGGYGAWTSSSTFTTLSAGNACPAPSGFIVSAVTNNSATISWNASPGASYYYVYYKKSSDPNWTYSSTSTPTKILYNLVDTTQYDYKVRSYCSGFGYGSFSAVGTFTTLNSATPCTPPTNITVSNITFNSAELSWSAIPGVMYYYIQYREAGMSGWTTSSSSLTNRVLTALADSTTYEFQMRSYCGSGGYGIWTPVDSFTTLGAGNACPPPSAISVSLITNNSATLNWTASPGAYYYYIYYKKSTDSYWSMSSSNSNTKTLFYLVDSTQYDYRMRSYCSGYGYGGFSAIGTFTTTNVASPCLPPTNVTVSNITFNSADISWSPVAGVMYYYIHYRELGAGSWTTSSSSTSSRTLYALADSTTYEFQVRSYCGSSLYGAWSVPDTFTTLSSNGACPAPTGLSVTAITNYSAMISWNAVPGAYYYYVYYKPSSSPNWTYTSSNTTSRTLFNLTGSTQYDYKVRSYCSGVGYGSFSAVDTFTTSSFASPCIPPTNITVANITSNGAEISWTIVPGVMYYYIQYREIGQSSWSTTSSSLNTRTMTSLNDSTAYEFQIRSYCGSGTYGVWSSTYYFTTLSAANNGCGVPSNLAVSAITDHSAMISWDTVPGVYYYQVQYKLLSSTYWSYTSTGSTSANMYNLTDSSLYAYRVRSYCPNGVYSSYTAIDTFLTMPAGTFTCQPPTAIVISNITYNTANIAWTAAPGAYNYQVQYRPTGFLSWFSAYSSLSNRTLYSLADSTYYEVAVRSNCGSNLYSAYTLPDTFMTLDNPNIATPISVITAEDITAEDNTNQQTFRIIDVNNLPGLSDFTVMPNPAREFITIDAGVAMYSQLTLMDLSGRVVRTFNYNDVNTYDISDLPAGLYIIRLSDKGNYSKARKLILN